MRLASYLLNGRASYGVVTPTGIADLGSTSAHWPATLKYLLASDPDLQRLRDRAVRPNVSSDEVVFLPVIPDAGAIFCVGLNYADHALETGRPIPAFPSTFLKLARSLVGHGASLMRPSVSQAFDWEAELAVVIGRSARHVPESRALEVVAGYTCLNDASIRDWQLERDVTQGKNFLASGACGPWLVTRDEIADPGNLTVMSRLNGNQMQNANTKNLIFTIPYLVAYYSTLTELQPGDIISTGTPAGVGHRRLPKIFLQPADVIEIEVSNVGVLRNVVAEEAHPSASGRDMSPALA